MPREAHVEAAQCIADALAARRLGHQVCRRWAFTLEQAAVALDTTASMAHLGKMPIDIA